MKTEGCLVTVAVVRMLKQETEVGMGIWANGNKGKAEVDSHIPCSYYRVEEEATLTWFDMELNV